MISVTIYIRKQSNCIEENILKELDVVCRARSKFATNQYSNFINKRNL